MSRTLLTISFCLLVFQADAKAADAPGEYINSVGLKMVRIPHGTFMMGQERQNDGKTITQTYGDRGFMGGELDEQPVHKVTISASFYMAATEVTNAQYEKFDPDHRSFRGRKNGLSTGDDEAVVFVSWEDAAAFCGWLSKKESKPYRLATEAEWEYACRAGTTTIFNTGDTLPEGFGKHQKQGGRPQKVSLKVGETGPNAWGLYDMHGNVEEWCRDWYGPYEGGEQTDPVGRRAGLFKVSRGGSGNVYVKALRSANRMSTLPQDKHWLIGFRIVEAPLPGTGPLKRVAPPLNAQKVSEKAHDWSEGPDMTKVWFQGPIPFVIEPENPEAVPFFFHNHCPSITWCPNGDLLAAWFSCARERGRELGIVASRFRRDKGAWEEASAFFNARDRNMHGTSLYTDASGEIYHLNGLGTDGEWSKLAVTQRTSTDSGATWSFPRLVDPVHTNNIPHMGISRTKENLLIFPVDMPGGTGLYVSSDNAQSWQFVTRSEKGRRIRGIHAPVVQLGDGRLMSLGRGKSIDGKMPMSLSSDMGRTWTYSAGEFPPINGGQRTVLLRLREGPILYVGFTGAANYDDVVRGIPHPRTIADKYIIVKDAAGNDLRVYGMFAAVSFDEGKSWPVKKLVTPGGPGREFNGWAWTQYFIAADTHAEPLGYLAATQSPDNVIHLISSGLHYRFNLEWLKTPMK